MSARTYPAMPYLRRLTPANGWHGQLVRDRSGEPLAIVAVPIGPEWTDAVAIEGEDRCVAMRHRTDTDRQLIVPGEPDRAGAVWFRDGRCVDVLSELFELQQQRPVWLHDARHTAASVMLSAGVPLKIVQQTLGHSALALTADT